MLRIARALGIALSLLASLGCSKNILQSFSNQTSDAALYQSAMTSLDNQQYSDALTQISQMSTTYAATNSVVELKASAYGGLCGLQFVPFASALSNLGTTRLLPFLVGQFNFSSATNVTNCESAETTLRTLGPYTALSNDDNFFLVTLELAKIGNILSYYTDPTRSGSASAGFDPCATTGANPISDNDARQIGVAFNFALASLNAVASVISTGSGSLTPVSNVCAQAPPGYNFCSIFDPTLFTANEVKGIRSLINESVVIGLGTNCTGDVSHCFCP